MQHNKNLLAEQPTDVLQYLFQYLDNKSLFALSQSSTFFQSVTHDEKRQRVFERFKSTFECLKNKIEEDKKLANKLSLNFIYQGYFRYELGMSPLSISDKLQVLSMVSDLRSALLRTKLFWDKNLSRLDLTAQHKITLQELLKQTENEFTGFAGAFTDYELKMDEAFLAGQPYKHVRMYLQADGKTLNFKLLDSELRDVVASDNIHPILKKNKPDTCTHESTLYFLNFLKANDDCLHYMELFQQVDFSLTLGVMRISNFPTTLEDMIAYVNEEIALEERKCCAPS